MLSDALSFFSTRAKEVDDVTKYDKNDLIRMYVANENNSYAEYYLSAIIVRYWHLISYYHRRNNNFEQETYLAWIIEGILKGLKTRGWTDETKYISRDKEGPRKVLDRCINTVVLNHYYLEDRDKRKVNNDTLSLDGGDTKGFVDFMNKEDIAEQFAYETPAVNTCASIIQSYINKGDMIGAIVLDNICFQDSIKDDKINMRTVCDNLININDNYIEYFKQTYDDVNNDLLNTTAKFFRDIRDEAKGSNRKVYACINSTLNRFKDNRKLMNLLCS